MHKLAIVGSREYPDMGVVRRYMQEEYETNGRFHLVTGGASEGVDGVAYRFALGLKIPYTIYPANWYPAALSGKMDRSAGFKRNREIVAEADMMVCFWDGTSRGTANDIYLWHMKTGYQPIVIGVEGMPIEVDFTDVVAVLTGGSA